MGSGNALLQDNKLVRLLGGKFDNVERKYTTVEREMLAIVLSYKAFKTIIGGNILRIFTDNKNLTFDPAQPTSPAQRWKSVLIDSNYTISHVSGKYNAGADWLSRNFLTVTESTAYGSILTRLMAAQQSNLSTLTDPAVGGKSQDNGY